ncbi:MAG: type II toxin-antitoxin system prevent-host-death family antitoxin [Bacteroidota bacterium]
MAKHVGVHQAKIHLSELLREAERGERIVIERYGQPVAQLTALPDSSPVQRQLGEWAGLWAAPDDAFSEAADAEVARLFEGRET